MYGTTSVPRKWECADLRNVFVGTGELKTHCTGAWMSRSARTRADCETVMRLTIWPGSNASPSASSNSKPTRKALPCDAEWPAGILTTSRKSLVFQRLSMRLPCGLRRPDQRRGHHQQHPGPDHRKRREPHYRGHFHHVKSRHDLAPVGLPTPA